MADTQLDPTKSYGWTGRILRVNLTDGTITIDATEPYKDYIGGMGLANKIMYDEVAPGTDPFSPENKVVFAVGPLTATGVPLAGRTTICSLSTYTKDHQIVDAHCGGMLGAAIKKAGYDAVVLEGASDTPVYLKIDDDVQIKPADKVWGLGTRATTEALSRREGTDFCVATIGPAGENLLPYACIINSRNHSAGAGTGAVMGSKMIKALVVRGTKPINVADPKALAELSDYMLREVVGSNNNHVVPSTQQEWAEYYDKGSRWTARDGLYWALAEGGPINTGEPKPGEINTVGYRCMKSTKDDGPAAEQYTIKMNGCHGCPIHCYSDLRVGASAANGGYETTGNTCVPNFPFKYMIKILKDNTHVEDNTEESIVWNQVMGSTVDDLGLWCNYAQLYRDIAHCYATGVFKRVLPPEEYDAIDWDMFINNDPSGMPKLLTMIAQNDSELSYIGHGTYVWTERWDDMKWNDTTASCMISPRGWPVHHSQECFGQVGMLYNTLFNRDDIDPLRRKPAGLRASHRAEEGHRGRDLRQRGGRRPGQELHPHERVQGELRVVVGGHRRAARLADAVQLGVAHGHEPHQGARLPRRPRPGGEVHDRRDRPGVHHRGTVQGRRQDHDPAARQHRPRHDRRGRRHGHERLPRHPRRVHRMALHEGPGHPRVHRGHRQDGQGRHPDGPDHGLRVLRLGPRPGLPHRRMPGLLRHARRESRPGSPRPAPRRLASLLPMSGSRSDAAK